MHLRNDHQNVCIASAIGRPKIELCKQVVAITRYSWNGYDFSPGVYVPAAKWRNPSDQEIQRTIVDETGKTDGDEIVFLSRLNRHELQSMREATTELKTKHSPKGVDGVAEYRLPSELRDHAIKILTAELGYLSCVSASYRVISSINSAGALSVPIQPDMTTYSSSTPGNMGHPRLGLHVDNWRGKDVPPNQRRTIGWRIIVNLGQYPRLFCFERGSIGAALGALSTTRFQKNEKEPLLNPNIPNLVVQCYLDKCTDVRIIRVTQNPRDFYLVPVHGVIHDGHPGGRAATDECIDPLKICSCYKGEGSDEFDDGRQHQAVDGEAEDGAGGRDHPGQDDSCGGLPGL